MLRANIFLWTNTCWKMQYIGLYWRTSLGLLESKMQYVSTRGFHILNFSNTLGHTSFLFYVICLLALCYLVENLLEHLENVLPIKHFGNANLMENFILRLRKNIQEPSPERWQCPGGMLTLPCYQLFPFKNDFHRHATSFASGTQIFIPLGQPSWPDVIRREQWSVTRITDGKSVEVRHLSSHT